MTPREPAVARNSPCRPVVAAVPLRALELGRETRAVVPLPWRGV
ncbi:hypothetical protein [Streptacidiphilus albus]|nr:hypothetical protein [Streptacidiphilus albus]